MKICAQCVLPETFPGIKFNDDGVCQFCAHFTPAHEQAEVKGRYRKKFYDLVDSLRSKGPYDVIVAYSGGKDSTYTLRLLKGELNMRVLAITFDNGFMSAAALANIRKVTEAFGIDHAVFSPSLKMLVEAFRKSLAPDIYPLKSLERASSVCNTCMNMVKSFMLKTAIERGVPLIAYGWSPGQAPVQSSVMRWNASMIRQMQSVVKGILEGILGENLKPFILDERHYKIMEMEESLPLYNVHPLAFLEYDEDKIKEIIMQAGWEEPKDTDANSTNCLLNSFGIRTHMERLGFHPYAHEIAGLVRNGHMGRKEGLEKLGVPLDESVIAIVKKRLGL